jgi:hypothetical protein
MRGTRRALVFAMGIASHGPPSRLPCYYDIIDALPCKAWHIPVWMGLHVHKGVAWTRGQWQRPSAVRCQELEAHLASDCVTKP